MSPDHVSWSTSAELLHLSVREIEGSDPELIHGHRPALKLLCDEFKFTRFGGQIQAFTDRWTSLVFQGETVHIERDKLVRTCSKFRDCPSLLPKPYHVTSSIRADVFRAFVKAIDGISPTLTDKNVTGIRLLCKEFGYEQLSATVAEFLALHSSPGERAYREIMAVKDEIANMKAENLRQG
jgi:hypothetical protein